MGDTSLSISPGKPKACRPNPITMYIRYVSYIRYTIQEVKTMKKSKKSKHLKPVNTAPTKRIVRAPGYVCVSHYGRSKTLTPSEWLWPSLIA